MNMMTLTGWCRRHRGRALRQAQGALPWLMLAVAWTLWLAGCASPDPNPRARVPIGDDTLMATAQIYSSTLLPGDQIVVTFSDVERPPPQQLLNIPDTGVISLPHDVHLQAAGKTTSELEKMIRDAYVPNIYINLTASVKPERRAFFVDGDVKNPGRQEYIGQMTVLRAIGTAGGFTDFANRKKIEVRRGGQRFLVNWKRALDHAEEDLYVFPGDHIIVKRTIGIW